MEPKAVEVVQEVVVAAEDVVLEVVQLEVEHPEVVQCPPPLVVVVVVDLVLRCSASGDC